MALIWSAKNFALQPYWRIFVLVKIHTLKHSNNIDTKKDIYLKDVIFALSVGARKLNACKKYHLYNK